MRYLLAAAMAALFVSGAEAQQYLSILCSPFDSARAVLTDKHGEMVIGTGVRKGDPYVVQLWVNKDRTSWTITLRNPSIDRLCVIASGDVWVEQDFVEPEQGDGT